MACRPPLERIRQRLGLTSHKANRYTLQEKGDPVTRKIRVAKGRLGVIKSVEGFRTTPTIARSTNERIAAMRGGISDADSRRTSVQR